MIMAGCAETHLVMNLTAPDQGAEPKVWPAPRMNRATLRGELTGEDNFRPTIGQTAVPRPNCLTGWSALPVTVTIRRAATSAKRYGRSEAASTSRTSAACSICFRQASRAAGGLGDAAQVSDCGPIGIAPGYRRDTGSGCRTAQCVPPE